MPHNTGNMKVTLIGVVVDDDNDDDYDYDDGHDRMICTYVVPVVDQ